MLGLRGDWWEGWLVGTPDTSIRALQTCLPSPPASALLRHRHTSPVSLSSRPGRAATSPAASPSSSHHERPVRHPPPRCPPLPAVAASQLHHLFWRPTLIPSTLAPLGLQYRSHFQLAIAERPPGDPGLV